MLAAGNWNAKVANIKQQNVLGSYILETETKQENDLSIFANPIYCRKHDEGTGLNLETENIP